MRLKQDVGDRYLVLQIGPLALVPGIFVAADIEPRPAIKRIFADARHVVGHEVIAEAVDTSLSRLQIDAIDLYQIHWPQRNVPMFGATEFDPSKEKDGPSVREQVEGMAALIKVGKIRYYGLSNETAWGVCEFHRVAKELGVAGPVTIQNSYSLVSRGVDNDLAEVLFREKMSLLAYSPLAGGIKDLTFPADHVKAPGCYGTLVAVGARYVDKVPFICDPSAEINVSGG